MTMTVTKP